MIALFISACTLSEKPANFDYGVVENNQYKNKFFNFTLDVPSDWYIQSKEETQAIADKAAEISSDDEVLHDVIDATDIANATLLAVRKYDSGALVAFNPNFIVITENVAAAREIKNGEDYLNTTKRILEQTKLEYSHVDENFEVIKLGSTPFYTMNTARNDLGIEINQRYYVAIINDFSLIFVLTYSTKDQLDELTSVIKTVTFGKS